MGLNNGTPQWSAATRVLFRFAFVYLLLYNLFGGNFLALTQALWEPVVSWVGRHVFGISIPPQHPGSGDTTYAYLHLFCLLVLAALASAAWTLLDRNRPHYVRAHEWLRVFVRVWLGVWMIVYGLAKPDQFGSPTLDVLTRPVGDIAPMRLLWTFMGASESYTLFAAVAEVLGGVLLLARRTTLLGALVCVGVLANVVMVNFCYDVPVKLFSTHLLAMAVFLILPDLRRLAGLFMLNRGGEPVTYPPFFARKWLNRAALALPTLLVVAVTGFFLFADYQFRRAYADLLAAPPLHGIWEVEEFVVDGEVRPPLLTDPIRWRRVIVSQPGQIGIQHMSDARRYYALRLDADAGTLALTKPQDAAWKSAISYRQSEPGLLALEGTFDGRTIRAKLRRTDESQFLLVRRGFHWINEYPFNP